MPEIDVSGAAQRLLDQVVNDPGKCLQHVWRAIGQGRHYLTGGGSDAFSTWRATPVGNRHVGDRNVPKNMPAYLGPKNGNNYGDVMISRGDGTFAATDRPNGRVGICTLEQRMAQTGRPYLGWADSMGGYDLIDYSTAGGGTPFNPEEEDMIQPLATRTIRNMSSGDVATLYPTGIALIGDPLTPDLGTASGIAFSAGQPQNDGSKDPNSAGFYWFDLPDDHFRWELTRHVALLAKSDAHLKSLVLAQMAPTLTDEQIKQIGAAVPAPDLSALVTAISTLDAQDDKYQAELKKLLAAGLTGTITLTPAQ